MPSCAETIRRNSFSKIKRKNGVCGNAPLLTKGSHSSENQKSTSHCQVRSMSVQHHIHYKKDDTLKTELKMQRLSLPYIKNRKLSSSSGSFPKDAKERHQANNNTITTTRNKSRSKDKNGLIECSLLIKVSKKDVLSRRLVEVYDFTSAGERTLIHCLLPKEERHWNPLDAVDTSFSLKYDDRRTLLTFRSTSIENKDFISEENDACLVIFSVSDKMSFQKAREALQEIKSCQKEDVPIILVADKNDKDSAREISLNEITVMASINHCTLVETSFSRSRNVYKLLMELNNQTIHQKNKKGRNRSTAAHASFLQTFHRRCRQLFDKVL